MSDDPLTAPPTGSPGNSVIGGLSTVEVRWILPGQLDAAIAGWFRRFPTETESREDAYLVRPVLPGLSVKIRAGRALEVKVCHGCPGILDAAGRARGRLESCRKWSFPVGPLGPYGAGPPAWTVVHKRRQISRFRLASGRIIAGVPGRATESACAVELTEVSSGIQTWWSLGFEATGPADLLDSTLQSTAALVFAQAPPADVEFGMSNCQSYVDWLSRRDSPAAG
ncbi:MAG: hypothetical protein ACRDPF_23745 [Streptosporangiaceae bacterium]